MKPQPVSGVVSNRLDIARLQQELHRIPGVTGARVVGSDTPKEIHIVASPERPPKQIARDVQSLAIAAFGLRVDHRIVSIVQLDEDRSEAVPERRTRPALDLVLTGAEGREGWAKVYLGWPDGNRTQGEASIGTSRELRARGATEALLSALHPALAERHRRIEVEHVVVQQIGLEETVIVRATLYEPDGETALVGSALVQDDVVGAAVRALLQAVNRKLS